MIASVFSRFDSLRAMDSTDAPVSTAVELATFLIRVCRYFSGSLRKGLVSSNDFLDILYYTI